MSAQDAIAIYVTRNSDIVIRSTGCYGPDQVIVFRMDQAAAVAEFITNTAPSMTNNFVS